MSSDHPPSHSEPPTPPLGQPSQGDSVAGESHNSTTRMTRSQLAHHQNSPSIADNDTEIPTQIYDSQNLPQIPTLETVDENEETSSSAHSPTTLQAEDASAGEGISEVESENDNSADDEGSGEIEDDDDNSTDDEGSDKIDSEDDNGTDDDNIPLSALKKQSKQRHTRSDFLRMPVPMPEGLLPKKEGYRLHDESFTEPQQVQAHLDRIRAAFHNPDDTGCYVLPLNIVSHAFYDYPVFDRLAQYFSNTRLPVAGIKNPTKIGVPYIGNSFMCVICPNGLTAHNEPNFSIEFSTKHRTTANSTLSKRSFLHAAAQFLRAPYDHKRNSELSSIYSSLHDKCSIFVLGPYSCPLIKKTLLRFVAGVVFSLALPKKEPVSGHRQRSHAFVDYMYSMKVGLHGELPWITPETPLCRSCPTEDPARQTVTEWKCSQAPLLLLSMIQRLTTVTPQAAFTLIYLQCNIESIRAMVYYFMVGFKYATHHAASEPDNFPRVRNPLKSLPAALHQRYSDYKLNYFEDHICSNMRLLYLSIDLRKALPPTNLLLYDRKNAKATWDWLWSIPLPPPTDANEFSLRKRNVQFRSSDRLVQDVDNVPDPQNTPFEDKWWWTYNTAMQTRQRDDKRIIELPDGVTTGNDDVVDAFVQPSGFESVDHYSGECIVAR
jgi:hypothetical protein